MRLNLLLILLLSLLALVPRPGYAQAADLPASSDQRAYLLDHPINPDWLILATRDGRYTVTRLGACDWLRGDLPAELFAGDGTIRQLGPLAGAPIGATACTVGILGLVDPTPCFVDASGLCDLEAGEHDWQLPDAS